MTVSKVEPTQRWRTVLAGAATVEAAFARVLETPASSRARMAITRSSMTGEANSHHRALERAKSGDFTGVLI
jgi:hypothetical protein